MRKLISGLAILFGVIVLLFVLQLAYNAAAAQVVEDNLRDDERGTRYRNWHTDNVLPEPIATLEPITPIPTASPGEEGDDGEEGSANIPNNRGVSYILQMCSNNAKEQRKFWNEAYKDSTTWNAGWLYGFTSHQNGCKWSKAFMQMPARKRVRVHICNCTCFRDRGRQCGANECFPGASMTTSKANQMVNNEDPNLYKTIDRIIALAIADYNAAPAGTVIDYAVSPCLESGLSTANRKKMMNYIVGKFAALNSQRVAAGLNEIKFVDNPLSGNCIKGRFCEKHGYIKRGAKGIADTDGVDYDNIAQATYGGSNDKAWMVLAWKSCLNGLGPKDKFQNPLTRVKWCTKNRDAANLAHFTDDAFSPNTANIYASADTKNCGTYKRIDSAKFVWKLGEEKNYTTWVTPKGLPVFKSVYLIKNGVKVDESTAGGGRRFGTNYSHEAGRRVYDFKKPLQVYPDASVLHGVPTGAKAANNHVCWKFPKPSFRPFNKEGLAHQQ